MLSRIPCFPFLFTFSIPFSVYLYFSLALFLLSIFCSHSFPDSCTKNCLGDEQSVQKSEVNNQSFLHNPLRPRLQILLQNHENIRSAQTDIEAVKHERKIAWSKWYPDVDITLSYGHHDNFVSKGQSHFDSVKGKFSQLLWDFGASNASIDNSRVRYHMKLLSLQKVRQSLLREAISVHINLARAHKVLEYAKKSENNIRQQTGLEEYRVAEGSGYSTDVLQAKAQLAGAISRRISSRGALIVAENNYRELFDEVPPTEFSQEPLADIDSLLVSLPQLPLQLDGALQVARDNNIGIQLALGDYAIAKNKRKGTIAKEYYPEISFSLERNFNKNQNSVEGKKHELVSKIELNMPFNLGPKSMSRVRVDSLKVTRLFVNLQKQHRSIEKQVRNGWQSLETSKGRAEFLDQQANISAGFLALARKERKLGRRSLVDLLSSETSLVNAQSDKVSAKAETLLATVSLLAIMGRLEFGQITVDQKQH